MEFRYRLKKKENKNEENESQSEPFIEKKSTVDIPIFSSSSENEIVNSKSSSSSLTIPSTPKKSNWRKDKVNICLLIFLYLLQGIPLGLAAALPLIIQTYGANWSQQATFSFAFWPFSLKLLWAPFVDSIYFKKFGRRKSWLIPVQLLIGLVMIIFSFYITNILNLIKTTPNSQLPVYLLTSIFFGLSFLAATQDIAVDGWALSMLSRENVGWASTCNSVGQTAGICIGRVVFLGLESKDFANNYIRKPLNLQEQSTGLVTIPHFFLFWGISFIISTTLIAFLKHEIDKSSDSDEQYFGLMETYKVLIKVFRLSAVRRTALILLTLKIGFVAIDAMTGLELTERGVTKDAIAFLSIPLMPLQIILPFFIAKYTTGPKPLNILIISYPFRLLFGIVLAVFVYYTPPFQNTDKSFPWYYYLIAIIVYSIHQIAVYNMFVSLMAFFAKISDPKIGGTYMTLLNTLANFGNHWVSTAALYAGDYLTWKTCSIGNKRCGAKAAEKECTRLGGVCGPYIDSYYIEVALCTIFGILWLIWQYKTLMHLQSLPLSAWLVRMHRRKSKMIGDNENATATTMITT
ncbi:unnamed protein product [Adineta steineri]|uniref:Acetyl-coenzyme A transporter 1 n=1 Tax=Adineta steineri TaxID=433720 RepID=A0A818HVL4_9BILA|nr:unnamed protein product [Adineta steineri]CAF3509115.1 unnamed protein product [Adineta steineri]